MLMVIGLSLSTDLKHASLGKNFSTGTSANPYEQRVGDAIK